MVADPAGPDPRSLWKDQAQEPDPVTLQQVHDLALRYDRRARRMGVLISALILAIGAAAVLHWTRTHDPITAVLFVGGELTTCWLVYRLTFPARDPAEPAGSYLRRRMQLRLAHAEGGWMLAVLPLAPVVVRLGWQTLQHQQLPLATRIAPFLIIGAGVAAAAVRARLRASRIRAELRELDALLAH